MSKIAIYPGTFDPITNGHCDVIKKALRLFDKVIVAVSSNEGKCPKYDLKTRVKLVSLATKNLKNVQVESFDNLLVDFAREKNSFIIIRGLRAVSDFEFELQLGYANASLWNEIETIFLMPSIQNSFISSSVVRSILSYNGDVSHLVPKEILSLL